MDVVVGSPLYVATNARDGVSARVWPATNGIAPLMRGFNVVFLDDDSGETIGTRVRVPTLNDARAVADAWVAGVAP